MTAEKRQEQGKNHCRRKPNSITRLVDHKNSGHAHIKINVEQYHRHKGREIHGGRCRKFLPCYTLGTKEVLENRIQFGPPRIYRFVRPTEQSKEYIGTYTTYEIVRDMYGLPQSGILANKLLEERLAVRNYYKLPHTLELFTHKTRPIWFTLTVDTFELK